MLLRYCLKGTSPKLTRHYYVKAYNVNEAIIKLIAKYPALKFTKIEQLGDALPAPKTATQLIKEAQKETAAKKRRWVAAQKYQLKSGVSIFAKT